MVIAVNTRLLLKDRLEGIGWFTYETLKIITNEHPEHKFIFIFDRPYSDEFVFSSNVVPVKVPPFTRHPVLWYLWFEYSIPYILKKYKVDIFLSPDGFLSLSTSVPSVSVIHDINFLHYPEQLPYWTSKYYNYYFPRFAQKASRIATVSEYSKNDISKSYSIDKNNIDVLYNGSNSIYKPLSKDNIFKTKQKLFKNTDCEYFVFVGALLPRKNIARLLSAFDQFRKKSNSHIKLVIVGNKMFMTNDIEQAYQNMQYKDEVVFTGRLSPEDLHLVLGSALALTFVPYFEGFGIPIIEAMNCDVPVITSNTTSMPEVAGDAAMLVDPYSLDSITSAMNIISMDNGYRENLILKGRTQRDKFSWNNTANKLWKSIELAL